MRGTEIVVSIRNGSGDVDDEEPFDRFFLAMDFLGVEAVGAVLGGEEWEAIVAE